MKPTIWYEPRVPSEVRSALDPLIQKHLHLMPGWVTEICVTFDPSSDNCMEMGTEPEYRRAHLTVTGYWLRADVHERDSTVRHEFCHTILHPLTDWTKDLIERLAGEDERLSDWLRSEWQYRLEGATCDLERAVRAQHDL
jgi:hypothetical protein